MSTNSTRHWLMNNLEAFHFQFFTQLICLPAARCCCFGCSVCWLFPFGCCTTASSTQQIGNKISPLCRHPSTATTLKMVEPWILKWLCVHSRKCTMTRRTGRHDTPFNIWSLIFFFLRMRKVCQLSIGIDFLSGGNEKVSREFHKNRSQLHDIFSVFGVSNQKNPL